MAQELIYTSAERGVKLGQSGFCTVAHSKGLSARLIELLETASVYRPAFELGDPQADKNPVCFQHTVFTVGGDTRVLSRVCFAGSDYTGRSNKLAHHVVLDSSELPAAGPAALIQSIGWIKKWSGDPDPNRPPLSLPPVETPANLRAEAWERLTGDAGWAGALAQSYLDDPRKPAFILFSPGQDVFPLMLEAMRLLPEAMRWKVCFSTYFTGLQRGMECHWRCCLPDSAPAIKARQERTALIIDLTRPAPCDVAGALVEAARSGVIPLQKKVLVLSDSPVKISVDGESCPNVAAAKQLQDKSRKLLIQKVPPAGRPTGGPTTPEKTVARKFPRWMQVAAAMLLLCVCVTACWAIYSWCANEQRKSLGIEEMPPAPNAREMATKAPSVPSSKDVKTPNLAEEKRKKEEVIAQEKHKQEEAAAKQQLAEERHTQEDAKQQQGAEEKRQHEKEIKVKNEESVAIKKALKESLWFNLIDACEYVVDTKRSNNVSTLNINEFTEITDIKLTFMRPNKAKKKYNYQPIKIYIEKNAKAIITSIVGDFSITGEPCVITKQALLLSSISRENGGDEQKLIFNKKIPAFMFSYDQTSKDISKTFVLVKKNGVDAELTSTFWENVMRKILEDLNDDKLHAVCIEKGDEFFLLDKKNRGKCAVSLNKEKVAIDAISAKWEKEVVAFDLGALPRKYQLFISKFRQQPKVVQSWIAKDWGTKTPRLVYDDKDYGDGYRNIKKRATALKNWKACMVELNKDGNTMWPIMLRDVIDNESPGKLSVAKAKKYCLYRIKDLAKKPLWDDPMPDDINQMDDKQVDEAFDKQQKSLVEGDVKLLEKYRCMVIDTLKKTPWLTLDFNGDFTIDARLEKAVDGLK